MGDDDGGGAAIGKPSGPRGGPERIVGGSGDGSGWRLVRIVSSYRPPLPTGSDVRETSAGAIFGAEAWRPCAFGGVVARIGAGTTREPRRRVGTASRMLAIAGTSTALNHRGPPGANTQQSGGSLPARIASATALVVKEPIGGPSIR